MLPLLPFDSLYNLLNCKAVTFKGSCRLNAIWEGQGTGLATSFFNWIIHILTYQSRFQILTGKIKIHPKKWEILGYPPEATPWFEKKTSIFFGVGQIL